MDKREITKKMLLDPVDWITLLPCLAGITIGFGAWAVNKESGLAVATSITLLLISAGIYLNRLLFGWNENYERLVNEWRASVESQRDQDLDRLYLELKKDGDPRTEMLLKDLRTLTKALLSEQSLMSEQSDSLAIHAFDIVSDVDKLFQRSVDYLKESLDLWRTADNMERESIKQQLLNQRETLISEVEKTLENLGTVLGSMKKAAINSRDGLQLAELREELSARLKIAEEVEEKIKAMRMNGVSAEEENKYLQYAE